MAAWPFFGRFPKCSLTMEIIMAANKSQQDMEPITAEAPPSTVAEVSPQLPEREVQARNLVKSYLPWAAGAGILPLPGVDLVAIVAVQLRMLAKMAELYGVPFREQAAKSVVAVLLGSVFPSSVAGSVASALKVIPVIGSLMGMATLPALAAAATYAVGQVFITHFEAGGTLLDFDPQKVRDYFKSEFEKAKGDTAGAGSA
jgi:uncharacterized protein (DUF697 family)